MTPEKLFQELLGLGLNWEVIESRFERESGTVFLEIRETARLWDSMNCPKEGGQVFCYDHTEVLTWRHLNVFEHRCEINCRLPRAKCRQCGHVFRVRPPWEGLSTHFSKEFEAFALLLMREMPMAKVAEITGEGDTRLWRMLFKHVDGAYGQVDMSNVCCVGVDEMGVRKGQEYISVFADLVAKKVIFATEGHGHETWAAFAQALAAHNGHPHAITQVSMDMSAGYEKGVKANCRNAHIVFDKFHVLANASKKVDQVRRTEMSLGDKDIRESLNKSQWLWRKNPENLSQEEEARLVKIKEKNLCTGKAYQMRLVLQDIYRSADVHVAQRRFKTWCRWVRWVARFYKTLVFAPMVKMANMIEEHLTGILAHWKWGLTNAFMEGLNSVFSAVKRKARGYRSSVYLITVLYLVAGKLRLPHV
ncbi:MAG: ISL3 family transposase [Verrucomicrobiota bacterium]|jgi:transposase